LLHLWVQPQMEQLHMQTHNNNQYFTIKKKINMEYFIKT